VLVIRSEQMNALGSVALRAFEDEMVEHLAEFSPPLFKAVKETRIREVIRLGTTRAREYGITFQGPVRLYLELMLLFGSGFDTDPQYPWAAEILGDPDSGGEMERAERLFEDVGEYRRQVGGPQDEYTLNALRKISAWARSPLPFSSDNFTSGMLREMAHVYPEKAAYVGEERLRALIDEGVVAANRFDLSTVRAIALVVVLMFAFGHGCMDDPLYPWIGGTLENEAVADPSARADRLEKKALTWLEHVLAYFDESERG